MQAKLQVLACTDPNTDIGKDIMEGGFGWWCESNDVKKYYELVNSIILTDLQSSKLIEWDYLKQKFSSQNAYLIISGG